LFRQLNDALPSTAHWPFDPWPTLREGDVEVEFRLLYEGRLPAASKADTRNVDKDRIRRVLSKQLAELFRTHPLLRTFHDRTQTIESLGNDVTERVRAFMKPGCSYSTIELTSRNFERCGQLYMPLIHSGHGIACSLEILFLRRDEPGNLIVGGGDLDNRIKVLFDALRLPQNCNEVLLAPDHDPNDPVFVLLEDDRLIVDLRVTSDRLLTPRGDGEHVNDVRLVIHVKTVILQAGLLSSYWS
jgi:hypothetical protein